MSKFIIRNFNNKDYKVYNNANFSIIVDRYCNAECKFCVENLRNQSAKANNLDTNTFLENIDRTLSFAKNLDLSISITGGEPTASPKFLPLLDKINDYNFRKRVITTNGSYLLDNDGEILKSLLKNNFDHLNISKTHFNESINKNLMQYKEKYFNDDDLKEVIQIMGEHDSSLRIRMSCVVNKEGISSKLDIEAYINHYKKLGIDNIVFRELMLTDVENISNKQKQNFYKQNFIDIGPYLIQIKDDPRYQLVNETNGYYYDVLVFDYKGVIVCFEKANLLNMQNKAEDEIYEFIYHENGRLCGSWNDEELILESIDI